jgi:hypothetical protein
VPPGTIDHRPVKCAKNWFAYPCRAAILFVSSCLLSQGALRAVDDKAAPDNSTIEVEGLHNVFRVTEKLYSGSGPESAASFKALQKLGIKTLIPVDGARPDNRLL